MHSLAAFLLMSLYLQVEVSFEDTIRQSPSRRYQVFNILSSLKTGRFDTIVFYPFNRSGIDNNMRTRYRREYYVSWPASIDLVDAIGAER